MSVASLSPQELGCFAAITVKLELLPIKAAAKLGELIAAGNVAAWKATYSDSPYEGTIVADEIEDVAIDYLAERRDMTTDHFGPMAYNMIANDGSAFAGVVSVEQGSDILTTIRSIEEKCNAWQDAQRRTRERAEQDAASFDECPQLPTITRDELLGKTGDRVIIATFNVNESDMQTDYHGGRQVRRVVIGFGKGKRESFKQLRKAAGAFPPTAHMGPGKDRWTVEANKAPSDKEYHRGNMLCGDSYDSLEFTTKAEAETAVVEVIATHEQCQDGYTGCVDFPHFAQRYGVEYHSESYENRENYSMGGGNYLGTSRYGGWKVTSFRSDYLTSGDSFEYFDPPQATKPIRKTAKAAPAVNTLDIDGFAFI